MSYTIQLRHDSASDWTSANPTLADGEVGFETDTGKFKIGNGTTQWSDLIYFPVLSIQQLWTAQQNFSIATLTDAATIAWNLNTQQVAKVTPTGSRAIGTPTNIVAGGTYILIKLGSGTIDWSTAPAIFLWPGGTKPTSATGTEVYSFVSADGTNLLGVSQLAFS